MCDTGVRTPDGFPENEFRRGPRLLQCYFTPTSFHIQSPSRVAATKLLEQLLCHYLVLYHHSHDAKNLLESCRSPLRQQRPWSYFPTLVTVCDRRRLLESSSQNHSFDMVPAGMQGDILKCLEAIHTPNLSENRQDAA